MWIHGQWVEGAVPGSSQASKSPERSGGLGFKIPLRWEIGAYAALMAIALVLRLWGLDQQAVHHDESLHGYFAYRTYIGFPYQHNPLTHGMFLFHSLAASFFLFGDNDFTLRLPMAIFGTGLVAVPLMLRQRMGPTAALIAAFLIAFSPALLYYSRFSRNDIYMAVFTLATIGAMFRYIDDQRNRWLYLAAGLIALGFTTKETQYMFVIIIIGFLVMLTWREVFDWVMGHKSLKEFSPAGGFLVLVVGLSLPMFAAGISVIQGAFDSITLAAENGTPGIATGAPSEGWGYGIAITTTVILILAGWTIGLLWKPKAWIISWLIFAAIYSALFTNFYTHLGGLGTGVWQSLGYWIAQQDVQRGGQPWYYYFMMSSIYEFLPFVMAVGTAGYYVYKSKFWPNMSLGIGAAILVLALVLSITQEKEHTDPIVMAPFSVGLFLVLVFTMTAETTTFKRFLLFWSIVNFALFSFAGEKMPWLVTHITLPFIILTATSIGDILQTVRWSLALNKGVYLLLAGVPLFFFLVWRLIFIELDGSFTGYIGLFLMLTTLGLMLVGMHYLGGKIGHSAAWGSVAVVMAVFMFGYTFRAGWVVTFLNRDVPRDALIYTQTSQDIRQVALEIKRAGELTGEGTKIPVTIDDSDSYAWPWQWYLRHEERVTWVNLGDENAFVPTDGKVAVINARNIHRVEPLYGETYTAGRRIQHRAWFPERYKGLEPEEFFNTIWHRDQWRDSIRFFVYRELPENIGSVDSYVYFSDDLPLSPLN